MVRTYQLIDWQQLAPTPNRRASLSGQAQVFCEKSAPMTTNR
jgi:hypothetical protein